jgi:DNA-binding IclR family transcriptional regulator
MPEPPDGQRHLVVRVFGILEAFSPDHPRLTLSDIRRRTSLPVATVHRLVTQLAALGALERGTDGRYSIGIRLWEIATLEPRGYQLRNVARPFLFRLQENTGSTVLLSVLDGTDTVVIEHVQALGEAGAHASRLGRRSPARSTPAGRVLASFATDPAELGAVEERSMAATRKTGISVSNGLRGGEPFSIAVPVRNPVGTVVAALSVEGRAARLRSQAVVRELRDTAEAVVQALGSAGWEPRLETDSREGCRAHLPIPGLPCADATRAADVPGGHRE